MRRAIQACVEREIVQRPADILSPVPQSAQHPFDVGAVELGGVAGFPQFRIGDREVSFHDQSRGLGHAQE